ncbi:MAG: hypothetical protein E6H08_13585 [Bacteroidetes bacterium]|nr:MAG: hypothetical protein E6H08_13585 [Bacteroidota bacterium]
MQRFLLSLLIILGSSRLFAQTIEDIEAQFAKGDLDKAKASVDAFLTKEKNAAKPDGWWYKGLIYNEIAKSEKYKSLAPEGRMEAFNAFKKYYELDPKAIRATLEQHVRLFDIYNGYFDLGVAGFGASKFDDSYTNFKNALMVEEYISGKGYEYNGFKFPVFDTTLIQNIALSAYRAKKDDEAAVYYKKIADQKIAGKDNIDIYQLLIEYYMKKGDQANTEKYFALGRELYPADDRWYQMELERVDSKDKKALFAKYEELMPKYPGKYLMTYNYAVELFNYTYAGDAKPADYKETQKKIESVLKTTIGIKKDYPEANVLMARHYYNVLYDFQDDMQAVKGTTPADQKKKADLKTKMIEAADQLIVYSQAASDLYSAKPTLKAGERGNYKVVNGYLATAYEVKGDKAKADEYRKKSEANN